LAIRDPTGEGHPHWPEAGCEAVGAGLGGPDIALNSSAASSSLDDAHDRHSAYAEDYGINPVTGLTMCSGRGGFDVGGHPYGSDD
jgi:hypothetical protein